MPRATEPQFQFLLSDDAESEAEADDDRLLAALAALLVDMGEADEC